MKAWIGSTVHVWQEYENRIFSWYSEARTASAKAQYITKLCGILPVAFFPNKDMFYGKIESDVLIISYDERALRNFRRKEVPEILPEIYDYFCYSDERYDLGCVKVTTPELKLDEKKLTRYQKRLIKIIKKDKFDYETVTLTLKGSKSYFEFLHTPRVQNFEKTSYKVKNLEELFVFAQEFVRCARQLNVRYFEVFVSAHEPCHQKIILDLGLHPRGYVPCWKYNWERNCFEDHVLFNYYEGKINEKIELLEEGKNLLKRLKVQS